MNRLARAAAVAACAVVTDITAGQTPESFWSVPADALASWAVDPGSLGKGALDRNRALADGAVCWLAHASISSAEFAQLESLFRQEVIGASPYRLVLLRFDATCPPPKKNEPSPAHVDACEAVLEVINPGDREALTTAVRRAAGEGPDQPLQISGLTEGHTTGSIQWGRTEDSVVIGFGEHSLEHWLTAMTRPDRFARAHDRALKRQEPPAFQAWVNLNLLREHAPELFAYGRIAPLIEPWSLSNSRSLYLAGRTVAPEGPWRPPLLSIDAAWSPRSEPTSSVHTMELTERLWPAELGAKVPADAPYAAVVKGDWRELFDASIATAGALAPKRTEFQGKLKRWTSGRAAAITETFKGLGERAVVIGPSATPGAPAAVVEAKPDSKTFARRFSELCGSLGYVTARAPDGGGWVLSSPTKSDPWHGLTWLLSSDSRWITFSWQPATKP